MGRLGLFDEDARVELIDGEIIEMAPIGDRHMLCVTRLAHLLQDVVGDRGVVSVQNPVRLDAHSEPQPDIALLSPPLDRYKTLPGPSDVLLVVEVADTTFARDRAKARFYARAGLLECWIVDLAGDRVLVMRRPGPEGYASQRDARRGETVDVDDLPGASLGVGQVLGPTT